MGDIGTEFLPDQRRLFNFLLVSLSLRLLRGNMTEQRLYLLIVLLSIVLCRMCEVEFIDRLNDLCSDP